MLSKSAKLKVTQNIEHYLALEFLFFSVGGTRPVES